jgi:hypothetical protein
MVQIKWTIIKEIPPCWTISKIQAKDCNNRHKIDTPSTQIHDLEYFPSGRVKLSLWAQAAENK